jgi:flavodoxin I
MARTLIVYSTITGNTQLAAETIEQQLKQKLPQNYVEVVPAETVDLAMLKTLQPGDLCMLAASTWEGHTVPQDMVNVLNQIESDTTVLSGKNWAVFGCGDTSYDPYFCHAVDILSEKLSTWGVKLVIPSLKVDGFPELPTNQDQIVAWCDQLTQTLG